jgi:hypothetical protein
VSVFPAGIVPRDGSGLFAQWQPRYAERGIVIFPVIITPDGNKKPAVTGYLKIGPRRSAESAIKFADAAAFGFACGPRNRITIVDLDDTDEAIIREGERLFGVSPVLWRTGGGRFAMPFRHNGERRLIRQLPGLPIDLLGGGYVVAPPSIGQFRPYEFLRGRLADFDDLPFARIPEEIAARLVGRPGNRPASLRAVKNGVRHKTMLHELLTHVRHCDDVGVVDVTHEGGSGPGDAYLFSFAKAGIRKGADSAPNTKKIPLSLVPEGTERKRRAAGARR